MYGGTANQMSAQPLSSQQQNMTRKQREDMGMAAATNQMMSGMGMGMQGSTARPTNMMAKGGKNTKYMAMGGKNKEFAALAPPRDKITYADKIAGATKTKRNG